MAIGVITDPSPDYVGIWRKKRIISEEDYSVFFLWSEQSFSVDNSGWARISDWEKTDNKLIFKKAYKKGEKEIIKYKGYRLEPDNYRGDWIQGATEGKFAITKNICGNNLLGRELFSCESDLLMHKIIDKRIQFPYLALNEIDF